MVVRKAVVLAALCAAPPAAAAGPEMVFVEAESFARPGGWVLDQQSMDQMGSSYLLAHGLGEPVADAVTTVRFPTAGSWRVWVRTRDWVAPHGPGRFRVRVGGVTLGTVFGVDGSGRWEWQEGDMASVAAGEAEIALADLTGFEGRCDALLFVRGAEPAFRPPNGPPELAALRRRLLGFPDAPDDAGEYEFVVAGGGYAGISAAVAAARLGLRVALIQDRPVLGGNASSEVRVPPNGNTGAEIFPRNTDILRELEGGNDARQLEVVRREKNISLFLNARVSSAEMRSGRIATVIARDTRTGREMRFRGALFADCTGDASLGVLAGAECRLGREARETTGETLAPPNADRMVLGSTNHWKAAETAAPAPFPECPWALRVTEESVDLPPRRPLPEGAPRRMITSGDWNWESGFTRDPATEAEQIRDHNFRAIYGVWDFLKNRSADKGRYANWKLDWVGFVLGKRESRRLVGDVVVTQQDLEENARFADGCVMATWYIDHHFPHPENSRHFPGEEFRAIAWDDPNIAMYREQVPGRAIRVQPFAVPYRAFYSRDVPNLFMAGRNISVTHIALGSVRVMRTTAMMGTVVGRAAWLCRKLGVEPRAIYETHLDQFKRLLENPDRSPQ